MSDINVTFLRYFLPLAASLTVLAGEAKALTVASYTNPEDLASLLLVPGWSPVTGSVSVAPASADAIGFFDNASDLGLTDGVLLTTGSIYNAPGPNTTGSRTGPGALSSLKFDFVAVSPGISWRYISASEEYEEWVGSGYNDSFSLSLNGENLALIPGTSTEVKINNVNQLTNTAFYRSNTGDALNTYNTEYDGLTTMLTASKGDLVVGNTYTVEFLITDVGDEAYDSGVFIGANSVSFDGGSPETPLLPPPPATPDDPWLFPTFNVFDPDFTFWLDPDVAIGYIYSVLNPSGPKFDSFTAPTLPFDNDYELFSSTDNSCSSSSFTTSMGLIQGSVEFDFTTALTCFAIKGIDVAGMLDPLDTTAFVAGISFDSTGNVDVTQTPIVQFVPDPVPGPLPLLGIGGAFAWSRRMRQRIKA